MLLLSFDIKDDKYVIDTRNIIEIITLVRLKKLPITIKGVAGLLNYHGKSIPIVDISELCDNPIQAQTLTTRIIIVQYQDTHLLGIKAENVTETIRINKDDFEASGIKVSQKPFLSDVADVNNHFIQLISIDQLLTDDIKECLFPEQTNVVGE